MQKVRVPAAVRFAAIGDSFTEGIGDDDDGVPRGWADLVALGLAQAHGEIDYANLAVRGRLLAPIATEQVEQVLALDPQPTLVTMNGGGNDMLRPGIEPARLVALLGAAARRMRAAGVEPVLLAGPDASRGLPAPGLIHGRGQELTDRVRELSDTLGLRFVSVWDDEEIRGEQYWAPDRLHLNAAGHRRAADIVLAGLGVPQPEREPVAPIVPLAGRARVAAEADYYARYVLPWVGRRLRRRSSGDGRTGKHPTWTRITPS